MTENLQDTAPADNSTKIEAPQVKADNEGVVPDVTPEITPDVKPDVKPDAAPEIADNKEVAKEVAPEKAETKDYPEDWREKIAKDDDKVLKKLQRLKTPEDLANSYFELEKKFSETRAKFKLPENPTPEDVAKFREENGVPEKAEGYDLNLGEGLVIGEYDKPVMDEFLKIAHEKNFPADMLKIGVESMLQARVKSEAETTKFLEETVVESEAKLTEDWGDKIKENKNKIATFLESKFGVDESRLLDGAIFPDGTSLSTNPVLLNKFLDLANNFHQTSSDLASNSRVGAERLAEIEKFQRTNRDAYFKDEPMQQEYRSLLALKAK